jgi:5-(carboxyamino)imidazole ribonucleotide mutase/phosphoribosylaminoimidazole-succinocarboxamide synthase
MPSGIVPAVVLEPKGAALLAAKILSLAEPALRAGVASAQQAATQKLIDDDEEVRKLVQ